MRRKEFSLTATLALCALAGCGHHEKVVAYAPPPPALPPAGQPASSPSYNAGTRPAPPAEQPYSDEASIDGRQPIYSEVGRASWYGPNYNTHRAANGDVYDQEGISAAHRTLPMGSLIRVTNLQTGQSAVMHVTDRGPFVPDRVIDLSVGAAKRIGVWRPGTAQVRIDVYEAPKSIAQGGRWCVQIGAMDGHDAKKLEDHLSHKYQTANVIEFTGPTGHWVRIRPQADDKSKAVEIAKELRPSQGEAYLVRLD
jgi:rare lipoprotein A